MDALADPATECVVVMKSAQVGWTEIINNVVGYYVHQDPAPMLVVQPTVEMGEAWSKDRLAPMMRDTKVLAEIMAAPRSRDAANTLLHKTFPGGQLAIAGANSAASLASRPIRFALFDEVDRYPASAGTEGDPITLGRKRTATFWNRKILMGSTPTIAGVSRIEKAFADSDQRYWWVPCPHCGEFQKLCWPQVKWPEGRPQDALYHCAACGAGWNDAQRWNAIGKGEWRAEAPFSGTAGFHMNEIISTFRRLSETAKDFLSAKDRPDMLKAWVNTALGETWQEKGEAPEFQRLYDRREEWEPLTVPAGGLLLTAGVDTQRDRLEASVWAWGRNRESWLVDHVVVPGSPFDWKTWEALSVALDTQYRHAGGAMMRVDLAALDTGDGGTTSEAYAFVRKLGRNRVIPIKGQDKQPTAIAPGNKVEVKRNGTRIGSVKLWHVGSSHLKGELYGHLKLDRPTTESGEGFPPGYVHLPAHVATEEYCRQLVAEELRRETDKKGFARREWVKTRERNEALDCRVYAKAAAALRGVDRWSEQRWLELEAALDMEAAKAPLAVAEDAAPEAPAVMETVPVVPAGVPVGKPQQQTRPRQRFAPAW